MRKRFTISEGRPFSIESLRQWREDLYEAAWNRETTLTTLVRRADHSHRFGFINYAERVYLLLTRAEDDAERWETTNPDSIATIARQNVIREQYGNDEALFLQDKEYQHLDAEFCTFYDEHVAAELTAAGAPDVAELFLNAREVAEQLEQAGRASLHPASHEERALVAVNNAKPKQYWYPEHEASLTEYPNGSWEAWKDGELIGSYDAQTPPDKRSMYLKDATGDMGAFTGSMLHPNAQRVEIEHSHGVERPTKRLPEGIAIAAEGGTQPDREKKEGSQ